MRFLRWLTCLFGTAFIGAGIVFFVWYFSPHEPAFVSYRTIKQDNRSIEALVINLTASGYTFSLNQDTDHPKSVQAWRKALASELVFNAGYFTEDNSPTGYFRLGNALSKMPWPTPEEQKEEASYSFLVRVIDGDLDLSYLPDHPIDEPYGDVFLSFPTLVNNHEPIVKENSYLSSARTILASDDAGNDYLILLDGDGLSLYEAAKWVSVQSEHFMIAGNLDGGPSTGLSLENGWFDVEERSAAVPSVIAGFR